MRRPLLALSLTVVLLAAPASCGGDNRSAPPREPTRPAEHQAEVLAQAWSRTLEAGTARLDVRVSGGDKHPFSFGGHGAVDFRSRRGRLSFELPALVGGEHGANSEVRFAGDVILMKLSPAPAELDGRAWLRIDLADVAAGSGIDLAVLRLLAGNDLTAALGTQLPVDLLVDEDGRLRRLSYASPAEVAPSAPLTTTIELSDFGVAVEVVEPPPDEVVDLGPLLRQQRQGSGP